MNRNKLLQRQLRKLLPPALAEDPALQAFLEAVDQSYRAYERDNELSARAFRISEEDYVEINRQLQEEIRLRTRSTEELHEIAGFYTDGKWEQELSRKQDELLRIARFLKQEISKRKNAEKVFTSLMAGLQSAIILEDRNRRIIFCNEQLSSVFNLPVKPADLIGADCAGAARQIKQVFADPDGFEAGLLAHLERRQARLGEAIEMADGRILQRDFIPILVEEAYEGHLWVYTDITERRKADEALRQSELTNRLILNASLDAIIIIDNHGRIRFWNAIASQIFGWSEDEVRGLTLQDTIIPPGYRDLHKKGLAHFHATGEGPVFNQVLEMPALRRSGEEFPVELSIVPIQYDHTTYFCGFIRDISARKKAEEEYRLTSIVARANRNGVVFTDRSGTIFWCNEGYEKMMGFSRSEILGQTPVSLGIGPLTQRDVIHTMIGHFEAGADFSVELIQYRKDGTSFWTRVQGQPVHNQKGELLHYFAMLEDISAERAREEKLLVLSQIAEDNVHGVLIAGPDGKITWVNHSFTRMLGYSLEEAKGRSADQLLSGPESSRETIDYLNRQLSSGQPFAAEVLNYHKDGHPVWVRLQGQCFLNEKNEFQGYFALQEDITKERELNRKLKESDRRLRLALEKIGDNVWEHDFRTGETVFSKGYNEFLAEPVGGGQENNDRWWQAIHPDDKPLLEANDRACRKGTSDSHYMEYRLIGADGLTRWVLDRGVVIEKDAEGLPLRMIGTHTNITAIKETESELANRVQQFRSLSENIPAVIYEYEFRPDGTGHLRYLSPAMERVFGIPAAAFRENPDSFVHPEDRPRIAEKDRAAFLTRQPFSDESRLVIPGNGIVWRSVNSSFSYQTREGGLVFTGLMKDITGRKMADEALRSNEAKYRSIIANMNLGLLEVDLEEKIQYVNNRFCEISGYTEAELIGKKASHVFLQEEKHEMMAKKNELRRRGISDAYEVAVTDKQGALRWWLVSGAPRFNDNGELVGSIGIHLDITENKKLELELVDAREQAEHSSRAKESFLANMSHEIRTPMNAILGMAGQLQHTALDGQQQQYLDTIRQAGEHLMTVIDDILDLSKIESGLLRLESVAFRPRDLLAQVVQVMEHRAREKGVQLSLQTDPSVPASLQGDPFRIRQVLLNLVSNAIKFTEQGAVQIKAALDEKGRFRLQVIDTGIGMDAEFVQNVFNKFQQEDPSITRRYGGSGLGMSISKQLVEMMRGEISVQSEKGTGSTFTVLLTLPRADESDVPVSFTTTPADRSLLLGKRILLVEDNELNRLVAIAVLERYGATLVSATNGQEAVERLKKESFDVVLMDMQMPVMDGLEATAVIRSELGLTLPVIALTANAIVGEQQRCLAAGMNDYLSKPFEEEKLIEVITRWLGRAWQSPARVRTDSTAPLYSLSRLQKIAAGNTAFVEKMIGLFLRQTPADLRELDEALLRHDVTAIRQVAHRMKPAIDNLEIQLLMPLIRELEKKAAASAAIAELEPLVSVIRNQLEEVCGLLERTL